jgi:hypothetical protein
MVSAVAPQIPTDGSSSKGLIRQGPWRQCRQQRPVSPKPQSGSMASYLSQTVLISFFSALVIISRMAGSLLLSMLLFTFIDFSSLFLLMIYLDIADFRRNERGRAFGDGSSITGPVFPGRTYFILVISCSILT